MANTLRNRRFRVNQLLKSPRQTRRLQRQAGKRYLIKPQHLRFANTVSASNNWNNFNNISNNNINHMNALNSSRTSIVPSQPTYNNVALTPNQAKLFANISVESNTPEMMLNRLYNKNITRNNKKTLKKKIHALYN